MPLVNLMLEVGKTKRNLIELHDQILLGESLLRNQLMDIQNKFAPKHLLGQELVIGQHEVSNIDEYMLKSKGYFDQGIFPRAPNYTRNLSKHYIGADIKIVRIELCDLVDKSPDTLMWLVIGVVRNKTTGEFGKKEISTYLFDKVEMKD